MQAELIILRLIHVLGGILWLGSGIFVMFFLMPALTRAGGPTTGAVMAGLQQRKMFTFLPIVAVLTMLSGLRLWWLVGGGLQYALHRSGRVFLISGAFAIIAFVMSLVVSRPAAVRIGQLTQSMVSDQASKQLVAGEIARLQRRSAVSSYVATALLVLAGVGMSIARYL